jgi:hypothetical protein
MKNEKNWKWKSKMTILGLVGILLTITLSLVAIVNAAPAGPQISYISNSTATLIMANRSQDAQGTITILTLDARQQDYKWKAYVGNVTGSLSLDDASTATIYDWTLASISGEVYVTRASSVNWGNVSCANTTVIANEDTFMGVASSVQDSINKTFNATVHKSFLVGAKNITNSTCRAIATYVSDAKQTINEAAKFQEVLLRDDISSSLIYTTLIDNDQTSYDGSSTYDFQLIVAENESASTPTTYFFYVELG